MKHIALAFLVIALNSLSVQIDAATHVYNLAQDWSDSTNPNGPWAYNKAGGVTIPNHHSDWDPTRGCCFEMPQPAWADATWPNADHVPMWYKSVSNDSSIDVPTGSIGMHGVEFDERYVWN